MTAPSTGAPGGSAAIRVVEVPAAGARAPAPSSAAAKAAEVGAADAVRRPDKRTLDARALADVMTASRGARSPRSLPVDAAGGTPRVAKPRVAESSAASPRVAEPRAAESSATPPRVIGSSAASPRVAAESSAALPRVIGSSAALPGVAEPRVAESSTASPRVAGSRAGSPGVAESRAGSPGADARAAEAVAISRGELDRTLADFAALTAAVHGSFSASGVTVASVGDGTIFQRAGLRAGDVITAVDGAALRSLDDAANLYARASTARSITAQIVRGGRPMVLRVVIQ